MAKKTRKKKKVNKKRKKKANRRSRLRILLLFLSYSVILGATLAATVYFIFLRPGIVPHSPVTPPPKTTSSPEPAPLTGNNKFKVAPDSGGQGRPIIDSAKTPPPPPAFLPQTSKKATDPSPRRPQVAILIDDMGQRRDLGREMIQLEMPLSFAFLPFLPHSTELMELAGQQQRDILLHLPMEATDPKWDPGPGSITTRMNDQAITSQVNKDLAAVPLAIGVNNHMGSRFSQDRARMAVALQPLKERHLFFIDSVTIASSVAAEVAGEMGLKTGRRAIFLDNDQDVALIKKQLDLLVSRARRHDGLIAIAHPHPATLEALSRYQHWLQEQVEVVPVHHLVQ
ncbi:MAG: divergent polysaccharide deacetylase family protein [Thermodesulfobacteriota bacterium]